MISLVGGLMLIYSITPQLEEFGDKKVLRKKK